MTQVPLFLSPRQAAERLTAAGLPVTEDTVRRWAREDQVEALKLPSGYYRIRTSVIDAILDGSAPRPEVAA